MLRSANQVDIRESQLGRAKNLLDILLINRTTNKNIIWATNSYEKYGAGFLSDRQITSLLITGKYEKLIQPRVAKSLEEQQRRTKENRREAPG